MTTKPTIAITMGDPAGVGPEVIVGAWQSAAMHDACRLVVLGHPDVLRRAVGLGDNRRHGCRLNVEEISDIGAAAPSLEALPCVAAVDASAASVPPAAIDPRGGQAAYDALVAATHLALDKQVDAIVTAPLNKAALWAAGHHYPGHTELLAELCGVDDFAMMLYLAAGHGVQGPAGLGVIHVTLHTALADVPKQLTIENVLAKSRLANAALARIKQTAPRIAVCALNPHAGEQGLFGREEIEVIAPAVECGRAEGLDLTGPLPADTAMVRARDGEFDAVVAMYHDQGHIALKLLGMHQAVNVTLGLPIVRTSVAHGTAFDLAWQGRANVAGMVEAVRVAALLAARRSESTVMSSDIAPSTAPARFASRAQW
ncbi:MAG: 4-hydroxythreonine-4-phosphate dehydrogenase PdxA [Pirellulales bacterium]|nr:4-hydroxythreonine-4-phosphate dehydrogenase PdxA [Pirellulales bacterium]